MLQLVDAKMVRVPRFIGKVAICCPFHAEKTPSCIILDGEAGKMEWSWICLGCKKEGLAYLDGEYENRDMSMRLELLEHD